MRYKKRTKSHEKRDTDMATSKKSTFENESNGTFHTTPRGSDTQILLSHSMKAMIGFVQQPLAAVEVNAVTNAARLLCATSGAERLIASHFEGGARSASLDSFLACCVQLVTDAKKFIDWYSTNGAALRLVPEITALCRPGIVLIHFTEYVEPVEWGENLVVLASKKGLTPCETKVFCLMARGLGNKEIARDLHTSVHTVRAHLRNIFKTLKVSSRVHALDAVRKFNSDPAPIL